MTADKLNEGEVFYPLHAFVCTSCFLVQLEEFESPKAIFSDYAYFSSFSASWLRHAEAYVRAIKARFNLGSCHKVIEVASNDGYLLQYFVEAGVPVLGIEPAENVAQAALARSIPTEVRFFGQAAATELRAAGHVADLMVANNVLAHVPDILDFLMGFRILLHPQGVATFEFPHLLRMIQECQFDTIYHEHFSYLSLRVVNVVLKMCGLRVFDVEQLPTHGGSLRVFACREEASYLPQESVENVMRDEEAALLHSVDGYRDFADKVARIKRETLKFLIKAREENKLVCGYGAAAKGNTFLNYCGIGPEFISVVADLSPHKQGTFLPGSRIPVVSPAVMLDQRPHYVMILPWNLRSEVTEQLKDVRSWGGSFVTAIPDIAVY